MQAKAIRLPDAADAFDWYSHLDIVKRTFALFSDVDVEALHPTELVYYFVNYVLPFVQDLQSEAPRSYAPQGIESFDFAGQRYLMPKSLPIADQHVFQHNTKVRAFIEASNLLRLFAEMRNDGIKVMPYFCAAVVKETENEYFNPETIAARGEAFRELPMSIVWEIFFCTLELICKSASATLQSMQVEAERLSRMQATRLGRWVLRKRAFAVN